MAYSDFKSIDDVCEKFKNLNVEYKDFVEELEFTIDKAVLNYIENNFKNPLSYFNETSICERLISPIINIVADENKIPVWPQANFDVDINLGLNGKPDYLFAPASRSGQKYTTPVACLCEAKQEKFNEAWGQTTAEMIAAQTINKDKKTIVYGIVSTGKIWVFGKLEKDLLTIDTYVHAFPAEKHKILNILNWIFCEARKNADKLKEGNN